MTFAVKVFYDDQGRYMIALWLSEQGREPPVGYTRCTRDQFREAWRARDNLLIAYKIAQLAAAQRATVEQAALQVPL